VHHGVAAIAVLEGMKLFVLPWRKRRGTRALLLATAQRCDAPTPTASIHASRNDLRLASTVHVLSYVHFD
jgi:hypothetical protein